MQIESECWGMDEWQRKEHSERRDVITRNGKNNGFLGVNYFMAGRFHMADKRVERD